MIVVLLALLLVAALFGIGFAAHFLWILAAIVLVAWLVGFAAHGADRRWYYW